MCLEDLRSSCSGEEGPEGARRPIIAGAGKGGAGGTYTLKWRWEEPNSGGHRKEPQV